MLAALVAAFVCLAAVILGWYLTYARQQSLISDLKISSTDVSSGGAQAVSFRPIQEAFEKRKKKLAEGILDLSIEDVANLWSRMFEEQNIVYLRATSIINPGIWENSFMKRYSVAQRQNVEYLAHLDADQEQRNAQTIRETLGRQLLAQLGEAPFERTYILTNNQLSNLEDLTNLGVIISKQSQFMDIRLCPEESIREGYRLDFGFAVATTGEAWAYDLLVLGQTLHGGRFLVRRNSVQEFFETYKTIQANSHKLKRHASFEEVVSAIAKTARRKMNLQALQHIRSQSESRVTNRCLGCFLESEQTLNSDKWKSYSGERRLWYEMLTHEHEAIAQYVKDMKPKKIIEVGCGPGRLLEFLRTHSELNGFEEIMGVECNHDMYEKAFDRFKGVMPPFRVMELEVRPLDNPLPYSEDHFDFCINAMNIVGWQENESAWLQEMLRCSRSLFFSVYKRGHEQERIKMYKTRGHEISELGVHLDDNRQIVLGDAAVIPGVTSRAYSVEEVEALCTSVHDLDESFTFRIDKDTDELLYLCFIEKGLKRD